MRSRCSSLTRLHLGLVRTVAKLSGGFIRDGAPVLEPGVALSHVIGVGVRITIVIARALICLRSGS
jgi:hypothetical protein